MRIGRFRRGGADGPPSDGAGTPAEAVLEIDAGQLRELSAVFAAPRWLRDLGLASWFLVGVILLLVGLVWLLAETAEIVDPVLAGFVVAAVTSPIVASLQRRGVPRALGAVCVLLAAVAVAVLIAILVIGGITSQDGEISSQASTAADKLASWLEDVGVSDSGATSASDTAKSSVPDVISTLAHGLVTGISGLASLAFGLAFSALALFFLLKDGPTMRAFVERSSSLPPDVARTITRDVLTSIRNYFGGVTIVAAFNAVVVGLGAWALGVPLAGTIAVVVFVTAYIPYIGAFVSGAFAVILALGSEGTTTALIMLVIVLLANGLLQNVVQPIAFGATLDLNPLVVLIVTIGAGCLFGMAGLVLAAPLTSAAVHITADLSRAKAAASGAEEAVPPDAAGEQPAPA